MQGKTMGYISGYSLFTPKKVGVIIIGYIAKVPNNNRAAQQAGQSNTIIAATAVLGVFLLLSLHALLVAAGAAEDAGGAHGHACAQACPSSVRTL